MSHPYSKAPAHAFWRRAVSDGFDPDTLLPRDLTLVAAGESVMSAGSCFAANIVPHLENAGIRYVWAERPHPAFAEEHREALSYHKFSAAYGNIYTARHLRQLIERAVGQFTPIEDRWYERGVVVDSFRPGLAFPAGSDAEFRALTRQHLECVVEAVRSADVFVFTLGLTEAWVSSADGAVFPACPGTVAGSFDPVRHRFHNFSAQETTADVLAAFKLMQDINPQLRLVLSVSPVPLVATATDQHVLSATIYSKSALRVAASEIVAQVPGAVYFPAYEIITGPQAPHEFFEANRRDPSEAGIDTVMALLLSRCGVAGGGAHPAPPARQAGPAGNDGAAAASLSAMVSAIECEEAAADQGTV